MKLVPYLGLWLYTDPNDAEHLYRAVPEHQWGSVRFAIESAYTPSAKWTDLKVRIGSHVDCPVLCIDKFPFQIRIQEVTRRRALDMVRFLVEMAISSHSQGFTPSDIHEGNLLWWDRPWFVDFDAFRPLNHQNGALTFVRIGYLLYKYVFKRSLGGHEKFDFGAMRAQGGWMAAQVGKPDFSDPGIWEGLRSIVSAIHIEAAPSTHWASEYGCAPLPELAANPKMQRLLDLDPGGDTLLDVGCNKGYVCRLLRDRYRFLMGFDADERSIDLADTEPGVNFGCFPLQNLDCQQPLPISERFGADTVLALALTHHLKSAGVPVSTAVRCLSTITRKHLIIEDIVCQDEYAACFRQMGLQVVREVPSHPESRRLVLWGR